MQLARMTVTGALALAGTVGPAAGSAQAPQPAAFLEQLTGEWTVVSEAKLGPGQAPVRTESREVARMIGGTWLVAESTGIARGAPFTSILTLGYDPAEARFVGTWISGRQTHMWSYSGSLDASGTSLTLDTEGPVMGNPERTATYREIIELEGPDRKVMRSMIFGPDGEWFEFQRAEYHRHPTGSPSQEEER
jgi:hypothetical protein